MSAPSIRFATSTAIQTVFASRLLRACRMRSVATSRCSCSPVIQLGDVVLQLGDVSFNVLQARRHAQELVGEQRAQQ